MADVSKSALGNLGETLVANWLIQSGWRILERNWHCRWGELDIVAQTCKPTKPVIAFVADLMWPWSAATALAALRLIRRSSPVY